MREYIDALARIFDIEDQPAWSAHLRSSATLRKEPKRHLADPSLALALVGGNVTALDQRAGAAKTVRAKGNSPEKWTRQPSGRWACRVSRFLHSGVGLHERVNPGSQLSAARPCPRHEVGPVVAPLA